MTKLTAGWLRGVSNRTSGGDHNDEGGIPWEVATNGRAMRATPIPWRDTISAYGKPPYVRCTASGYLVSQSQAVNVDGFWFDPRFAPKQVVKPQ